VSTDWAKRGMVKKKIKIKIKSILGIKSPVSKVD